MKPPFEMQNNTINITEFDTSKKCLNISTNRVKYKNPIEREKTSIAPDSSLTKPNYEDILRRVSIIIHQHICTCEDRLHRTINHSTNQHDIYRKKQTEKFLEDHFLAPQFTCQFIHTPIISTGFMFSISETKRHSEKPTLSAVHEFLNKIFIDARLSAECSIERLMENAHVLLLANTWRPCLLCGLLLASKVWQDISSWNSDISTIYPQFTISSINRLERIFCEEIKWKLYISSSSYAKYYYSLRSLTEKKDFRRNYNAMMVDAPGAQQVAERTEGIVTYIENTVMSRSL